VNEISVYCYYDLDIQVYLIGTADGFNELAFLLTHPPGDAILREALASSYPACLKGVSVMAADSPLTLLAVDGKIAISGKPVYLANLAATCKYMADKDVHPVDDHIHEEYYEGHPYFAKQSLSCIIGYIDRLPDQS